MIKKNLPLIIRVLISALLLLSAIAKLYPIEMFGYSKGLSKGFEEGQLIPMGISEGLVPYLSRFIIAIEFFLAITILQSNYLKKIILPLSITMLVVFSVHLSFSIFSGDSKNCGCFGELIPMSPLAALIKNIISIAALVFLYRNIPAQSLSNKNSFSRLSIQFLSVLLLMFSLLPVQITGKNKIISEFSKYVISDIDINKGKKILCFFDADCSHCMEAGKSLTDLSKEISNFPEIHIIFTDLSEDKIPEFFKYAGKKYSYQVLPNHDEEEDNEINTYMDILGYDYGNPAVIYLDNGNQIRFYEGVGANAFNAKEFKKLFQ
jgi:hypothetical protein